MRKSSHASSSPELGSKGTGVAHCDLTAQSATPSAPSSDVLDANHELALQLASQLATASAHVSASSQHGEVRPSDISLEHASLSKSESSACQKLQTKAECRQARAAMDHSGEVIKLRFVVSSLEQERDALIEHILDINQSRQHSRQSEAQVSPFYLMEACCDGDCAPLTLQVSTLR
jgi:hypothetical protein